MCQYRANCTGLISLYELAEIAIGPIENHVKAAGSSIIHRIAIIRSCRTQSHGGDHAPRQDLLYLEHFLFFVERGWVFRALTVGVEWCEANGIGQNSSAQTILQLALLGRHFCSFLASFRQAYGDRLLSAFYSAALSTFAGLQRPTLFSVHRTLDAFGGCFSVSCHWILLSTNVRFTAKILLGARGRRLLLVQALS